jgi:hypothetical protein
MLVKKLPFLFCFILFLSFIISCDRNNSEQADDEKIQDEEIQTVLVTFINESSHYVKVHRDSFYGPVIAEVNTSSRKTEAHVRPSDNDGIGTIFSIEYVINPANDDFKNENKEVSVSCYDANVQIKKIIKAGEPCTVQIPRPANLACKTAFIKIINNHNLPVELRYVLKILKQADNKTMLIEPYKQGLYKLDGIPDEGEDCLYYNITATFDSVYFSDFNLMNGNFITKNAYIFHYAFNGTSIEKTWEEKVVY